MREHPSLIGKRFEKLIVEEQVPSNKYGQRQWLCRCDCGGTRVVTTAYLNNGRATDCGCGKSPDLTGKVFGRLTVLGRSEKRSPRGKRTTPMWECRCECGAITYKATDTLTNGDESMCAECAGKNAAQKARAGAGFVGGTQISKIRNMNETKANTSGCRGVYYDKKTNKYRARLRFQGKMIDFGTYDKFEDAVFARKKGEDKYYGEFLEVNGYEKQ